MPAEDNAGAAPALLGPLCAATLIVRDLEAAIQRYTALGLDVLKRFRSNQAMADSWQDAALAERAGAWLAAPGKAGWLRLLECPEAQPHAALSTLGHFAMEINCAELHSIAARLPLPGLTHLGGPAPLDVSDSIVAMQVLGEDGEVLYLTQILAPLPPFQLPLTTLPIDRLFIAVIAVRDRQQSLDFYRELSAVQGLSFDTRIGVINRLLQRDAGTRCAVATVQLAGDSLLELDELQALAAAPSRPSATSGIGWISLEAQDPQRLPGAMRPQADAMFAYRHSQMLRGPSGELLELLAV